VITEYMGRTYNYTFVKYSYIYTILIVLVFKVYRKTISIIEYENNNTVKPT